MPGIELISSARCVRRPFWISQKLITCRNVRWTFFPIFWNFFEMNTHEHAEPLQLLTPKHVGIIIIFKLYFLQQLFLKLFFHHWRHCIMSISLVNLEEESLSNSLSSLILPEWLVKRLVGRKFSAKNNRQSERALSVRSKDYIKPFLETQGIWRFCLVKLNIKNVYFQIFM